MVFFIIFLTFNKGEIGQQFPKTVHKPALNMKI